MFRGRELSQQESEILRAQSEGFDTIDHIDEDIVELIEIEWPHRLSKLDKPRRFRHGWAQALRFGARCHVPEQALPIIRQGRVRGADIRTP